MKITRKQLRRIIKEELARALTEDSAGDGELSDSEARDLEALVGDAITDARSDGGDISSQGEDPSNRYVVVNYNPFTTSTGKRRDADIDGHVTYIDKEFDDKEELEATIARGGYWLDDYGDEITGDDANDLQAALDKYKSERG